jgi:HB1, ASXL, restriction endonuclease HTH domain
MSLSWREAIEKVLLEENRPLHYSEISEQALARGYYKTDGATPDATVNATITSSIKHEGDRSPFVKVSRGTFALRVRNNGPAIAVAVAVTPKPPAQPPAAKTLVSLPVSTAEAEPDESVIRCLGMYWQRDLVVWRNDPKVFGKQQALSKPVDFGGQRGIYILYDHHTVVYVGRSVDRPLGRRLYEHTIDRLGSRWNRFSWFGLLEVTDAGKLIEVQPRVSLSSLIATLEALLIEALEPPQNRKRGDDFAVWNTSKTLTPNSVNVSCRIRCEPLSRSYVGKPDV